MVKHKMLVIDARRCTGCEVCESVCSMVHDNEFNPINSRIHRIRIEPVINTSIACMKCYDPACIKACQINALSKNTETGVIQIDYNVCDGCAACVRQCPYGVINISTKVRKAIVCDLCESTPEGKPQCMEYCPKGAIFLEEFDAEVNEDRIDTMSKIIQRGFPGEGMLN